MQLPAATLGRWRPLRLPGDARAAPQPGSTGLRRADPPARQNPRDVARLQPVFAAGHHAVSRNTAPFLVIPAQAGTQSPQPRPVAPSPRSLRLGERPIDPVGLTPDDGRPRWQARLRPNPHHRAWRPSRVNFTAGYSLATRRWRTWIGNKRPIAGFSFPNSTPKAAGL
jgi:hypothetical protein